MPAYRYNLCPECGDIKKKQSVICQRCRTKLNNVRHRSRLVCPECGKPKSKKARVCLSCMIRTRVGFNNPNWKGAGICPTCDGYKTNAIKTLQCKKCNGYKGRNWWEMGLEPWDKNVPRDLATRQKISIAKKERIASGLISNPGLHGFSKGHKWDNETTRRMFLARRKRPNKKEQLLFDMLAQARLPYKYVGDGEFILGGCCPDFLNVNGEKKLIELFGNYWHRGENPENRINFFHQFGFDTMIIWESELKEPSMVIQKIKAWV